jgi:addiction module RelE/StbE family toxin
MVKVVWTELSTTDLKEIFDYIAEDSVRYATITTNKIYYRVQPLCENPFMGRMVPEINKKDIRELIEGSYRIIYRLKNDSEIDILRVYHVARLLRMKSLK